MKRLNTTHQTIIEAQRDWERPITDIIQAAGNGQFSLWTIADRWEAKGKPISKELNGWVELDAEDILPAITQDFINIRTVRQNGQRYTLAEPQKRRFGFIFVELTEDESRAIHQPEASATSIQKHPEEKMLTTKEAADYLGFKPNTLDRWRSRGEGPEYTKVGARIRYSQKALDKYLGR